MNVPTREEFAQIVDQARTAGRKAVEEKLAELKAQNPNAKIYDCCGGAILVLEVDGRSALGKFLKTVENNIPHVFVHNARDEGGFTVGINGMHNRQEKIINEVADQAALEVLVAALGVKGHIRGYVD